MMKQLTADLWLDFSPRTNEASIGHYMPLHLAWSGAASQNRLTWKLISGDQYDPILGNIIRNMNNWPSHFTIKNICEFLTFLNQQDPKKINILIYEGGFVTFYFFLFISKFCKKRITVHFNWSNNNQLEEYSRRRRFKVHFSLLNLVSKRNFIHYVENEPLMIALNNRSKLLFNGFPTSTVFDKNIHNDCSSETDKLALVVNDIKISQAAFNRIIECIERVFQGYTVVIYSYREYEVPNGLVNSYWQQTKQMDLPTYFDALNGTWISFFFYNEDNYKFLTSGRFLDCLFVNSLICVPHEAKSLDWLGQKFGNLFHIDFNKEVSNQDIETLFQGNYREPKIEFSPNKSIKSLIDDTETLTNRSWEKGIHENFYEFTILFCIFFLLQAKFIFMKTKRVLHKLKKSVSGK